MKMVFQVALLGFSLGLCFSAPGQEVARAWTGDVDAIAEGPYVYASISIPCDALYVLADIDGPENDPFAAEPSNHVKKRPQLNQSAPVVNRHALPRCLPPAITYRDVSNVLIAHGVGLKGREWALHGSDPEGRERIYFCTSLRNADIIDQIFQVLTPIAPRTLKQLATLVSVASLGDDDSPWTIGKLQRLAPVVHSRHGIHGRSGEKFHLRFSREKKPLVDYEIEPTLGENSLLVDFRLAFFSQIPESEGFINQKTAVTTATDQPLILDCGIRDKSGRNYFLILQTKVEAKEYPGTMSPMVSLKKIDGIYAFPAKPHKPGVTNVKLETHSYRVNTRFLTDLRSKIDSRHRDGDEAPFPDSGQKNAQRPEPPARVTDPKPNQHHSSGDDVYDITPHLRYLGLPIFKNEWVRFNKNRNTLIMHGTPGLHTGVTRFAETICPTPRMARIQAEIVEVDRSKLTMPDWKTTDLKAAGSTLLAKYSTIVHSGEKATCGASSLEEIAAKLHEGAGKEGYELEIEPTLSEDAQWIDVRYSVKSNPLGDEKLVLSMVSALTLVDGISHITEIGHPCSPAKSHLLILRADVISPDGRFYRDRFKPLEQTYAGWMPSQWLPAWSGK